MPAACLCNTFHACCWARPVAWAPSVPECAALTATKSIGVGKPFRPAFKASDEPLPAGERLRLGIRGCVAGRVAATSLLCWPCPLKSVSPWQVVEGRWGAHAVDESWKLKASLLACWSVEAN
jgi:hypothetical protein